MIERITSPSVLQEAMETNPAFACLPFDAEDWLSDDRNFALRVGEDVATFEFEYERLYTGHYFFKSRGAEAIKSANEILDYMFSRNASIIRGLIPLDNKAAKYMTRKLGFTSYGVIDTRFGPFELFIQTRVN